MIYSINCTIFIRWTSVDARQNPFTGRSVNAHNEDVQYIKCTKRWPIWDAVQRNEFSGCIEFDCITNHHKCIGAETKKAPCNLRQQRRKQIFFFHAYNCETQRINFAAVYKQTTSKTLLWRTANAFTWAANYECRVFLFLNSKIELWKRDQESCQRLLSDQIKPETFKIKNWQITSSILMRRRNLSRLHVYAL